MTVAQFVAWLVIITCTLSLVGLVVLAAMILRLIRWHTYRIEEHFRVTAESGEFLRDRIGKLEGRPASHPPQPPGPSMAAPAVAAAALFFGSAHTVADTIPYTRGSRPMDAVPAALTDQGKTLMRCGDYAGAAFSLEEATRQGADPAKTLVAAAECHFYLGDYDKAIALCDQIIREVPNSGRAYTVRGLAYIKQGHGNDAREQFEKAVSLGDDIAATLIPQAG